MPVHKAFQTAPKTPLSHCPKGTSTLFQKPSSAGRIEFQMSPNHFAIASPKAITASRNGGHKFQSKVKAAEIATTCGIPVVIANSRRENVIADILVGKQVGTYFKPQTKLSAVKRWIAYGASVKGQIHVNAGAMKAILKGSSLLPVGVTKVVGHFDAGDVVSLIGEKNIEFAKGNPNYSSGDLNVIKGLQVTEVKKKLGATKPKEVIERRNIHLTSKEIKE